MGSVKARGQGYGLYMCGVARVFFAVVYVRVFCTCVVRYVCVCVDACVCVYVRVFAETSCCRGFRTNANLINLL